jgi:hypothetical protein
VARRRQKALGAADFNLPSALWVGVQFRTCPDKRFSSVDFIDFHLLHPRVQRGERVDCTGVGRGWFFPRGSSATGAAPWPLGGRRTRAAQCRPGHRHGQAAAAAAARDRRYVIAPLPTHPRWGLPRQHHQNLFSLSLASILSRSLRTSLRRNSGVSFKKGWPPLGNSNQPLVLLKGQFDLLYLFH